MDTKIYTEVKVANYEGRLEELTKKYSGGFTKLPLGTTFVQKYGLIKTENELNYIIIVSQAPIAQGPIAAVDDYNLILSVMGPNQNRVKQLMQEFETKLGIGMRSPPKHIEDLFKRLPDALNQSQFNPNDN